MADQPRNTESAEKPKPIPTAPLPPAGTVAEAGTPDDQIEANKLSPEEQMRLFEKELKEKDWGHQPC
jgi:hypothetical protein